MANQTLIPPPPQQDEELHLLPQTTMDESLWASLKENVRAALFPEKLPPLELTSRPVKVREIWGEYNYKKESAGVSLVVHIAMIAALIAVSIMGATGVKTKSQGDGDPHRSRSDPAIADDARNPLRRPAAAVAAAITTSFKRRRANSPRPRWSRLRLPRWLSAMTIRSFRSSRRWSFLLRLSWRPTCRTSAIRCQRIPSGPPSNGTGGGGGIGSGNGGGVGSGSGPGVGPGHGGGIGGGVFRVGGGVSAPKALDTPDPEYSEEARKAKYQGTCVLWLIVGPDGKPRDIKVARALGMGLDQKAIEAVRNWKFEPAMKDGKPVAVQINVEVNFRLY